MEVTYSFRGLVHCHHDKGLAAWRQRRYWVKIYIFIHSHQKVNCHTEYTHEITMPTSIMIYFFQQGHTCSNKGTLLMVPLLLSMDQAFKHCVWGGAYLSKPPHIRKMAVVSSHLGLRPLQPRILSMSTVLEMSSLLLSWP